MRKLFLCALTALFFAVGTAYGQTRLPEEVVDSLYVDGGEEIGMYADDTDEEEIGNFDFLYTNNGETLNYDELMTENLISEAMSHLGTRYSYGSKGPRSFDCSGFTSYVYKQQNNVNIGYSSRDQYARNTPIKRSELQTGDLVFFTSPGSGRQVGHVGIVVEVDPVSNNFTFIHASTHHGVTISKSTEANYQRRYVGARRVK